ncbi:MAG: Virulence sensor protein BvgS precursor [Syntrophorhabdus sp. PtaU1.Bin153]|nr:MAG: Virulence sensor protein BvgS precursor [Syntrophorhabdus sp. PtaU1.Bin153]
MFRTVPYRWSEMVGVRAMREPEKSDGPGATEGPPIETDNKIVTDSRRSSGSDKLSQNATTESYSSASPPDIADAIKRVALSITERRKAEQFLAELEKKYRDLIENGPVAVFQATLDEHGRGDITYVNRTFLRLLGYESLDEVRGINGVLKNPSLHGVLAYTLIRDYSVTDQEVQLITNSGEIVYWAVTATRSGDLISVIAKDITLRKKSEILVRQQLVFIEQLLDCMPVPVYYKDTRGIFLGCNKAFANFLAIPKEGVPGSSARDLFPPDIAELHSVADKELLGTRRIQVHETVFPHSNGTSSDVIYTRATYNDADGDVAGVVGVLQDITERKQAENRLRASEIRYRNLFDYSNDCVFLIRDSVIVGCNRKTHITFCGTKEKIVGKPFHIFFPPLQPDGRDSREAAAMLLEKALSRTPQFFEWRHQRLTGELFDSEVSLTRIDIEDEKLIQVQVRDISHRKEAESRIRQSELKYRNLVENSLVAILQTSTDGRMLYANNAFLKMFRYDSPHEITRTKVQKLIARRQDWRTVQKECIKKGHVSNIELDIFTRTDDRLTAMCAVTYEDSTMTWILVDITERRTMERELKVKTDDLYESNTALKVLLDRRDKDRQEIEEKIISNVKDLVHPHLESLTGTFLTPRQEILVSAIKTNLDGIISPFLKNMRYQYSHFTPSEVRVAGFIKDGKTTKEIANILGVSESAVNLHRQHIRTKLGLKNEKINLRTHLQSLED